MAKEIIIPKKLRTPSSPFSWGIKAGDFVFLSGMVAIDSSGNLVGKGDAKIQARQCLENIKGAVESAGGNVKQIIKVTNFFRDLGDYPKYNEARAEFFKENGITADFPASTAVQAKLIRDDFLLEIEAVAYLG